jgi:choline dehydrogenase-like flavoprotein
MRGDVVVIVGGPVGAVAARRFAEAGRAVIMLEAGPATTDPPGCHIRNQARFQRDPDSFLEGIADRFTYFDEAAAAALPGACATASVGGQGVLPESFVTSWPKTWPDSRPGGTVSGESGGFSSDRCASRQPADRWRNPTGSQRRCR